MTTLETVVRLVYLAAAACFVLGLHLMKSPASARRGNRLSAAGMLAAVLATGALLLDSDSGGGGAVPMGGWIALGAGTLIGAAAGVRAARKLPMTAMPQLVSLFNAVGGGAAALVGMDDILRHSGDLPVRVAVPAALDVLIGAVTFTGSLVAAGKLQGMVPGRPLFFPGIRVVTAVLALVSLGSAGWLATGQAPDLVLILLAVAAAGFGVVMVLPIGGADMPVVVSLLNAFTGTAVAMAGFVIDNDVLIVAGALVGASGAILTGLMAAAMNRSVTSILVGGFGTGDTGGAAGTGGGAANVRAVEADDAAIRLAYAGKVVIVPGYGLAAAQAQHAARELADLLIERGVEVSYAIHPVAGRMPGHMNVLLAEANVPYDQLHEMEQANGEFPRTDVALVVGANDVTNPAARRPGTAISGMPILDVDHAQSVIVIKRSLGHGYAGIDNELYTDPKTAMLFADAKAGLGAIAAAVKATVA